MRFVFLLAGLLASPALMAAESGRHLVIEDPVRVTVTVEPAGEGGENAMFQIGDDPAARVKTLYAGGEDFHSFVIWRTPYLLIRSSSGGNCWDCDGEAIFKVEDGKVRRVGDINTDIPSDSPAPLAGNQFVTLYTRLEVAAGFCHACSPNFLVSLFERDGKLAVDGESSWRLNLGLWRQVALLTPTAPPDSGDDARLPWETDRFRLVVAAAALAKYCGHDTELADLQARWDLVLDAETRQRLAEALELVKPLEPVAAWNMAAPY